jgi:hypothetical protein
MLKKGRCSNSPAKCKLAQSAELLPYAGMGSLCPECGAPLALVSIEPEINAAQSAPPKPTVNNASTQPAVDPASYDNEYVPSNSGLEWARNIAIIVILGALVFLGLKFAFNPDRNNSDGAETILGDAANIQTLNPTKVARIKNNLSVKASPDESANEIGTLVSGVVVDVTGLITKDNIAWARITMPNQSTQSGFVHQSDIESLGGDSDLAIISGPIVNEIPPADGALSLPMFSEVSEIPAQTFYVTSNRANIRAEAGVNATRITEATRGQQLVATASRIVDNKTWYRVKLANGSIGWLSGSLLSTSPPPPLPEPVPSQFEESKTVDANELVTEGENVIIVSPQANIRSKPVVSSDTIIGRAERGMVMRVDEVQSLDGTTWYHVKNSRFGIDGWISSSTARGVN